MLPANSHPPAPASEPAHRGFGWLIAGIGLVSFGCMMLVMAVAFARDLRALQDAPAILWSALCGQPVQSELTMPALLAIGAVTLLAGAGALLVARARRHTA